MGKTSSIPVPATVDPAVPDKTSPVAPAAVEVSGLLGERIRAQTFDRILNMTRMSCSPAFARDLALIPGSASTSASGCTRRPCSGSRPQDRPAGKDHACCQGLIAAQGDDGYLGTYVPEKRFGLYKDADWDVWVAQVLPDRPAVLLWNLGRPRGPGRVPSAGDLLASMFPRERSILMAGTHVGMAATSILEPIVLLYRATGEKTLPRFRPVHRRLVG